MALIYKPDKRTVVFGAGAGVALAQTFLTRQYATNVPFIGDIMPTHWGQWNTLGNILIGGAAYGLSLNSKYFKKKQDLKNFLTTYGIICVMGGLLNGLFPAGLGYGTLGAAKQAAGRGLRTQALASRYANKLGVSPLTGRTAAVPMSQSIEAGHYTQNYYPGFKGNFYRRPQTMAKGFGSDVAINPKANLPTEIPYNHIIA